jgi:hypothetical protein
MVTPLLTLAAKVTNKLSSEILQKLAQITIFDAKLRFVLLASLHVGISREIRETNLLVIFTARVNR